MTTVLFFQDLAWTASDIARRDILTPYPTRQWHFANSLSVPEWVSDRKWGECYDNFYGYSR